MCIIAGCDNIPYYNYKNEKGKLYCKEHKLDKMVNKKYDYCIFDDCLTQASYNYENVKKPIYCKKHIRG
jgi:hypothetical protein